jgi:CRISPR/Cas system endoribonuclease Cas6 (RAMP superfamily)
MWREYTHYSARQKQPMRLGGVTGTMLLSGVFSPYEYALLRFGEIFHAGKNTNFGLGKFAIWEKDE